jgi:hypothetical protein
MLCYLLLYGFKGVNKKELRLGVAIFAISELCISLTAFIIETDRKLSF